MNRKKQVKTALEGYTDSVRACRDGSFIARQGYFYRHGLIANDLARKIQEVLPLVMQIKGMKPNVEIISIRDNWQPWPRDSFFEVTFKLKDKEEGGVK